MVGVGLYRFVLPKLSDFMHVRHDSKTLKSVGSSVYKMIISA